MRRKGDCEMYGLPKEQDCPYCGQPVEDHLSNWNEETEEVTCYTCDKKYTVRAVYEFKGFQIDMQCEKCGEWTDDGMALCDCEEDEQG
jgi:hypothetical protein